MENITRPAVDQPRIAPPAEPGERAAKTQPAWLRRFARKQRSAHELYINQLWKERRLVMVTISLSAVAAVFEGLGVGLIVPLIQSITDAGSGPLKSGWTWFDVEVLGIEESQMSRLLRASALILLATWFKLSFNYMASWKGAQMIENIQRSLRLAVFDQLTSVSLTYFSTAKAGAILTTFTTQLQRVKLLFGLAVQGVVRSFLLIIYVVAIIWIAWKLALLSVLFFGLLTFVLTAGIRWVRRSAKRIPEADSQVTSRLSELIGGIRTVISFGTQRFERNRFKDAADELMRVKVETDRRRVLIAPMAEAIVVSILVVMVAVAMYFFVLPGRLEVALLLAFIFALLRLLPTVEQLNNLRAQWAAYQPALRNVADLVQRTDKPYILDGTKRLDHFEDRIVFEHVDFSYEPDKPVLKDISLEIQHGQIVAFVGGSGAGKSTLVDLISRFYDATEGRITIDGTNVRELQMASIREKIAVVSQDTFLFNDTVAANIAYGMPEVSMERICEVAQQANALEFIEELPKGFETELGDRGVNLSGGQRQRLAIARALLRDPEILILDEATSALDSVSEKLVQTSLEYLMQGRTVIMIAHRLSTVENADWIFVLEEGAVAEEGRYADLLSKKGQLWEYHAIQYGGPNGDRRASASEADTEQTWPH